MIEKIAPDEKELEKRIIEELSPKDAYKHVTQLLTTAPRLAGTPAEKKTAEYFKKTLQSYGIPVKILEFEEFVSYPSNAELKVISPVEKEIVAMVYAHSASTAQKGLEGELVYVGHGAEEDYEKVDMKGKIAFVRFSSTPLYNEKIRIAEKHGAVALILMNWTKPENRLYHMGAAKHVWGNPTLEMLQDLTPESFAHIPCLSITRIDGEYLRELLESQSVCVWMRTKVISEWRKVYEPVATINGSKEPEYFVLMGGHYDAYGSGTTDNATGNALLLELAKILYRNRSHLKRSVRFAWWTGHETAKQAGSTWYLDNNWDDINRHCIAYYNCDSPGMKGTSSYTSYNFAEIRDFQEKNVKDILGEKTESARLSKWADQSFWGVGVPSAWEITSFSEEDKKQYGTFGWWYHSDADTLDKVDLDMFAKVLKVYAISCLRLCNSKVFPFDFTRVADEFAETLLDLQSKGKGILDLNALVDKANELKSLAVTLNSVIDKTLNQYEKVKTKKLKEKSERDFNDINRCLMCLSRILSSVNYCSSQAGRYGQDRWGERLKPLPALQEVTELASMRANSKEFKGLKTGLIRERNRVLDALQLATDTIKDTLERLTCERSEKIYISKSGRIRA